MHGSPCDHQGFSHLKISFRRDICWHQVRDDESDRASIRGYLLFLCSSCLLKTHHKGERKKGCLCLLKNLIPGGLWSFSTPRECILCALHQIHIFEPLCRSPFWILAGPKALLFLRQLMHLNILLEYTSVFFPFK